MTAPALTHRQAPLWRGLCLAALLALLAACGGGSGGGATGGSTDTGGSTGGQTGGQTGGSTGGGTGGTGGTTQPPASTGTTTFDAVRLAHQASFGPNEALVAQIKTQGASAWVQAQLALSTSRYQLGANGDLVHKNTSPVAFCDQPAYAGASCWNDWFTAMPTLWEFYRHAMVNEDQLRQRMALALQQILVVSNVEVTGTYGFRNYHNMMLEQAFGNYRELLRRVTLSPMMGQFLNNANNHRKAPNENFARELLQLFSLGTCELNADGSLTGGVCKPVYNNETVRAYAYALTGWTYPPGGATSYGCYPEGANCLYLNGDMVPLPSFHDQQSRRLLGGVTVPAGSTAPQALELVLDSLMQHPNMAPFIGRQLIQHLVTSNPSAPYVQRVANAFTAGRHSAGGVSFGDGQRGSLAATVAAILLDDEARSATPGNRGGKLREPVLLFTGVLRAMNGYTDGQAMGWWWGDALNQLLFMPPSVFNFYPPDYPVAGTTLAGPAFGIHNASTALNRLNFLTYLLYWGGSGVTDGVPQSTGTAVNLNTFAGDAPDPAKLVDRLSVLAYGEPAAPALRNAVIAAVQAVTPENSGADDWQRERVRQAAYLLFGAPQYQVHR